MFELYGGGGSTEYFAAAMEGFCASARLLVDAPAYGYYCAHLPKGKFTHAHFYKALQCSLHDEIEGSCGSCSHLVTYRGNMPSAIAMR